MLVQLGRRGNWVGLVPRVLPDGTVQMVALDRQARRVARVLKGQLDPWVALEHLVIEDLLVLLELLVGKEVLVILDPRGRRVQLVQAVCEVYLDKTVRMDKLVSATYMRFSTCMSEIILLRKKSIEL